MKKNKMESKNRSSYTWIFLPVFLVTFYINPSIQDPFNSPKMWILLLSALFVLPYVIFNGDRKRTSSKNWKTLYLISAFFLLSLIFSLIYSDNYYISIFGDIQRRNGFISYFSLLIIWLYIIERFDLNFMRHFNYLVIVSASLFSIYANLQSVGIDFVSWDNPYNNVIGTVGNPNFSAALMAIFSSYLTFIMLSKNFNLIVKLFILLTLLLNVYAILASTARQGVLAFLAAVVIGVNFILPNSKPNIKKGYLLLMGTLFIIGVAGILQIGPASKFLYKPSVTVRGYYWDAAIKMFINNPLHGIGLDRYGYFFKQYREEGYPLKYGFTITSSAAHNVFLQMFATGGLFLGISYLAIVFFTFFCGVKLIKRAENNKKIQVISIVCSWIAFQAQSLISIDNLGVSIWGWTLSGLIIGYYFFEKRDSKKLSYRNVPFKSSNSLAMILGFFLFIPGLLLCSNLYQGEKNAFQLRATFNPRDLSTYNFTKSLTERIVNSNYVDQRYKIQAAVSLIQINEVNQGISYLELLAKHDTRDQDCLNNLAFAYETVGDFKRASSVRESITQIDPWGAENIYQLGLDYKTLGDLEKAKIQRDKILSFAANTEVANRAIDNLPK